MDAAAFFYLSTFSGSEFPDKEFSKHIWVKI